MTTGANRNHPGAVWPQIGGNPCLNPATMCFKTVTPRHMFCHGSALRKRLEKITGGAP